MVSLALLVTSVVSAFLPWTSAQNTTTPSAPGLTYLYTLNCTLGTSIDIGDGPKGQRVAIPITGGSFAGPRLSGKLGLKSQRHTTTACKTLLMSLMLFQAKY